MLRPLQSPHSAVPKGASPLNPAGGTPLDPEAKKKSIWLKLRATEEERGRWQGIAENSGVTLSDLMRSSLDGLRLRKRRGPPKVAPELLRELARIGNNLNQLAHAANRRQPSKARPF